MSLADTAANLLLKNGEAVVIEYTPTTPAYNPITGAPQTASSPVTVTANGYPSGYKNSEIDGNVIKAGDIKLILELLAVRPSSGDYATVEGLKYRVMDVMPIRKAGADIIYICQLRAN